MLAVGRNPALRRVELAWAGCITTDSALNVALAVYAFRASGLAGLGILAVVRSLPAAVLGPGLAAVADRYRSDRVLESVLAALAALFSAIGLDIWANGPVAAVYLLAAVAAVVYAVYWPAQSGLLPLLARTPEELTAVNVASTGIENVGTLLGPAGAGVLVATVGTASVLLIGAALVAGSALAVLTVGPTVRPPVASPTGPGAGAQLQGGFRALAQDRLPRLIVLVYLAQIFLVGALSVLTVVIALEAVHLGPGGVGYLNAAVGAGGVAGSVATLGLVGRRRLAPPLAWALLASGAALTIVAAVSNGVLAAGLLVVLGIGNAIVDVTALTLLQRVVRRRMLIRVLGVVEGLWWAMVGLGGLVATGLVDLIGVHPAVAVTGATAMAAALLSAAALRRVDEHAQVPERQLRALRSVPMFAGQPPLAMERLAFDLIEVEVPAGSVVIRQGDVGDRFYMIDEGRVEVVDRAMLDAGDWFGEIALLDDVPRTATVTAVTDTRLFALEREDFLDAVTAPTRRRDSGVWSRT